MNFCDPLQDELTSSDIKSTIFEAAPGYEYRIPRYKKSIFIQNQIDTIKIKNRIWPKRNVFYNLAQYDEVKETVFKNTGIKLPLISQVIRNAILIERLSYFWEDKQVINPRLVFMVAYYGEIGMALNLACNRLNIPSVDIQHGVQGDYHVAYGRWSKVPLTGYELLPKVFWVWSGNEHAAIEQWCQPVKEHHRPIVGGNPWLSMWKEPNYHIVIEYDKILIKLMNKQPGQFNILYTLQPGYDPPEWLLNFIREAPLTWMWWIRLHPGMAADKLRIKELFANCRPNNIDIDNASIIPLPALLRHVNLHITQFSTTVIEAAEFGVPSIILDKDATLIYSKLIEYGHAK